MLEARTQQHPHLVDKLESEGTGVVVCRCNNYPTSTEAVRNPAKNGKTKKVKACKQTQNPL